MVNNSLISLALTATMMTDERDNIVALTQAAVAEPDTVAVPHQELHAGAFFPGEEEGFAFPGRMPGSLSGEPRQGVDAGAHVCRLTNEPEGMRVQHRLSSRMMAAMPAGEEVTQAR